MIMAAFILACVIIDIIRLHSAMITATMIAADCSRMTLVITLTLNPNSSIVEAIIKLQHLTKKCNTLHEIVKLTSPFKICPCWLAILELIWLWSTDVNSACVHCFIHQWSAPVHQNILKTVCLKSEIHEIHFLLRNPPSYNRKLKSEIQWISLIR